MTTLKHRDLKNRVCCCISLKNRKERREKKCKSEINSSVRWCSKSAGPCRNDLLLNSKPNGFVCSECSLRWFGFCLIRSLTYLINNKAPLVKLFKILVNWYVYFRGRMKVSPHSLSYYFTALSKTDILLGWNEKTSSCLSFLVEEVPDSRTGMTIAQSL